MFVTRLRTEKVHGKSNVFIVTSPLKYVDVDGTIYTVSTGRITDLSTFWLEGRHTPSAVLHDELLKSKVMSRYEADKLMLRAMMSQTEQCSGLNVFIVAIGITIGRYWSYAKGLFCASK